MPYDNESVLECELMVPSRPRVGISQISLRQIPFQQNASHGFRILLCTKTDSDALYDSIQTNRQAIAAQGTDILNATIGGNSRRPLRLVAFCLVLRQTQSRANQLRAILILATGSSSYYSHSKK